MKNKKKEISLIQFLRTKPIQKNISIIENILGIPIALREFSGAWKDEGIFVKEFTGEYTFLSRDYSDPDKNGRGNLILARDITLNDLLAKENESSYVIGFKNGGGASIYDEGDLNIEPEKDIFGLRDSFIIYNQLLTFSGIPSIRRVN